MAFILENEVNTTIVLESTFTKKTVIISITFKGVFLVQIIKVGKYQIYLLNNITFIVKYRI